ncbi:MAG TPA: prepilin-type N-terminal cleavage/methylation domain-containing protein [Thermoanaerobaculia bacterium]|nr:prepilin-type N-terminal cleavage/methylation domain-containing protein [Thermoanaerobaculia bacterium]
MNRKRRLEGRQTGFTLIELLIVVAIIGIIAALLIPNFLDALQKAKQKRTVADIRNTGTAMFSWLTDQVGAAAAGQTATEINLADAAVYGSAKTAGEISTFLVPQYLQSVPDKDGWKHAYDFYVGPNVLGKNVLAIRSNGRDTQASTDTYTVCPFDPTDYDQDIVWADGFFVRWPQAGVSGGVGRGC